MRNVYRLCMGYIVSHLHAIASVFLRTDSSIISVNEMLTADKTNQGRLALLEALGRAAFAKKGPESYDEVQLFTIRLAGVMNTLNPLDAEDRQSLGKIATFIGISKISSR